jgi:dGTPase
MAPQTSIALATYATDPDLSRGRLFPENPCPMRTPFQRDRDRIVHATAFRRLTHKTQVFLYHEGDHYRTRLTHSLEVAQIARALARMLRLDEDLTEALALAHDLGHPPFGHAGERALDAAMAAYGGFDHNAQSLDIVTRLERKYAAFDGLNLTFETLDGLIKHNGPLAGGPEGPHKSVIDAIARAGLTPHLRLDTYAAAEAQAAAIADDIAYNNHDIDDGLRAGLITLDDLRDVPLVGPFVRAVLTAEHAFSDDRRQRAFYEVNRRMITVMIADVVEEARRRLAALPVSTADAVSQAPRPMLAFSAALGDDLAGLRTFLFERVYRHPRVMTVMRSAESIVRDLVGCYMATPDKLPAQWADRVAGLDHTARAARIGDFVAGMTDRYAIEEHRRLFDATPELR